MTKSSEEKAAFCEARQGERASQTAWRNGTSRWTTHPPATNGRQKPLDSSSSTNGSARVVGVSKLGAPNARREPPRRDTRPAGRFVRELLTAVRAAMTSSCLAGSLASLACWRASSQRPPRTQHTPVLNSNRNYLGRRMVASDSSTAAPSSRTPPLRYSGHLPKSARVPRVYFVCLIRTPKNSSSRSPSRSSCSL